MQHKPQFPKQGYRFTEQLEPDKIPNCIRSLSENGCLEVRQVGLRVRYIPGPTPRTPPRPHHGPMLVHYIAAASVCGKVVYKCVYASFADAAEALALYVTGPRYENEGEVIRRSLYEAGINTFVASNYSSADRIVICVCRCDDPQAHA